MIQNDGTIASESISNGYILENNPNIKNEKEAGFTAGQMTQKVMFDINSMSLKSVHTFKPNENYIQSDYGWVIYVKRTNSYRAFCSILTETILPYTIPIYRVNSIQAEKHSQFRWMIMDVLIQAILLN